MCLWFWYHGEVLSLTQTGCAHQLPDSTKQKYLLTGELENIWSLQIVSVTKSANLFVICGP